ncbi:LysR family transcriptional regulator [Kribbella amoyensis]|uniref:LysR family transcriptional regulator n=1 Tax=Kribbella amoyensis TaxID=996641 RepID=A0A561BME5_9ACTN|nr:LysR family transcriptional regulator [Kribbella amoyensis]TWD80025.1 LysR family transcriptional regulator [Kribbella amoyensis]
MDLRKASFSDVNARELHVFLVLAEELHFARAAERLYLSQPHVSRTLAALEHRVGGPLLARTSRTVSLTPLGMTFLAELRPAYTSVVDAITHARAIAGGLSGELVVGCTATTALAALTRLVERFTHDHPECNVTLRELPLVEPFTPLTNGEIDILAWWHIVADPQLTLGPVIDRRQRFVVMRSGHPIAARDFVSLEDLAEYGFPNFVRNPGLSDATYDMIIPARTPSGRPIPKVGALCHTLSEAADLIARTDVVHLTTDGAAQGNVIRGDLVFRPIEDLPPLPLGLIWRTGREDPRILAFAATAG